MSEALGPHQGPQEIDEERGRDGAAEDEFEHQTRPQAAT
jgi:hypothetical protein